MGRGGSWEHFVCHDDGRQEQFPVVALLRSLFLFESSTWAALAATVAISQVLFTIDAAVVQLGSSFVAPEWPLTTARPPVKNVKKVKQKTKNVCLGDTEPCIAANNAANDKKEVSSGQVQTAPPAPSLCHTRASPPSVIRCLLWCCSSRRLAFLSPSKANHDKKILTSSSTPPHRRCRSDLICLPAICFPNSDSYLYLSGFY